MVKRPPIALVASGTHTPAGRPKAMNGLPESRGISLGLTHSPAASHEVSVSEPPGGNDINQTRGPMPVKFVGARPGDAGAALVSAVVVPQNVTAPESVQVPLLAPS